MLTLWQYPPAFGLPSLSPFCVKVEAYLQLRRLPYEVRVTNNPRRGPHGKMPVLVDGAQTIADSRLIVTHLERTRPGGLDAGLTARESAIGHAALRMTEEHLYFAIMRTRWLDDAGFAVCAQHFATAFPFGLRRLALGAIRRSLQTQCKAQGFGRLTPAAAETLAAEDLRALETLIAGPFLLGDRPTSFDASIYAFLETIRRFPRAGGLRAQVEESTVFRQYLQRFHDAVNLTKPPLEAHAPLC